MLLLLRGLVNEVDSISLHDVNERTTYFADVFTQFSTVLAEIRLKCLVDVN